MSLCISMTELLCMMKREGAYIQCDSSDQLVSVLSCFRNDGHPLSDFAKFCFAKPCLIQHLGTAVHWCSDYGFGIGTVMDGREIRFEDVAHLFDRDMSKCDMMECATDDEFAEFIGVSV